MLKRLQKFQNLSAKGGSASGGKNRSSFFWGPRQTGKSTLLKELFPGAVYYDLLLSDEYFRLAGKPALIRQELTAGENKKQLVIIDEVQKIPILLDEVHWLMENHGIQFILCGSSPRKLLRGGGNLLGGRAIRNELFPLVYKEIPGFDLLKALNNGLLPAHYLSEDPRPLQMAYIGDYMKEEILEEAQSRNIPLFSRFLETSAFSNGEAVNYSNIARESAIPLHTVRDYFEILLDTMMGRLLPVYQKRPKRRVIHAPKFYFFDTGIANILLQRGRISLHGELFGKAFEHFIYQELIAYNHYSVKNYPLTYWRTTSQYEVDFILGDADAAIEVKGTSQVNNKHLKGIKALNDEYKVKKSIVVSLDPRIRETDGITIYPWKIFLDKLWDGKII